MQCNIGEHGRRLRLISGIVTLLGAVVLAGLAVTAVIQAWRVWLIVAAAGTAGAFQIFEARAGWCALRAMGVKTPV